MTNQHMQVGQTGMFMTSCGTEISGEVVEVNETGYVVKGRGLDSNAHEDGLFRFTFG